MTFKTTYFLFGLLIVVLCVFNLAVMLAPIDAVTDPFLFPAAHEAATKVTAKEIVRVQLRHRKPTKQFIEFVAETTGEGENAKKVWHMEEPAKYRVNETLVTTLINQVLDAKHQQAKLDDQLEQWELDDPSIEISLVDDNGKTYDLTIGKQDSGQLYALSNQIPDQPIVVMSKSIDHVFKQANDFRSRDLLAATIGLIQHLEVKKGDKEPVILTTKEGKWRFEQPDFGLADYQGVASGEPDKPTGVHALLSAAVNLRVIQEGGFLSGNASSQELKKYGLDAEKEAELVVTVKLEDKEETRTLLIGKEVPGSKKGNEQRYARLSDQKQVVKVPASPLKTFDGFLAKPEAVRDHSLLQLSGEPDVIRIKYSGGKTVDLIKMKSGGFHGMAAQWKMFLADGKAQATDDTPVRDLLRELQENRAVRRFVAPDSKEAELGKETVEISFWVNGLKQDEKNEDDKEKNKGKKPTIEGKPTAVLTFGKEDLENGLVVVHRSNTEDKNQPVQVSSTLKQRVAQPPLTYLARQLEPFTKELNKVEKLTIEQNGKTSVVAQEEKSDQPWTIKQPESLAGRKADATTVIGILRRFETLQVVKWVTLDATAAQLKEYGLDKPSIKVSMKLKGDEKPVEFLIGGRPKENKQNYYVKKGDNNIVFEISDLAIKELDKPLQDMRVVTFRPSEVKTLKVTGWKSVIGRPVTRTFAYQANDTWKMVSESPLSVSDKKLSTLVGALSQLHAKEFVVYKTGPTVAHGLSVDKGALKIEVTMQDDKTHTITIGNKANDNSYFAMTETLKGDVFTIDVTPFDKVRAAPAYLLQD